MQVGIDSFAAFDDAGLSVSPSERLRRLVEQIEYADKIGLDVFGVGEHHRKEFLDSAPAVILAARSCTNETDTSYQCCNCVECSRPSKGVSRIRNTGSSVAGPGGAGCWPRFIHRSLPFVRI